MPISSRWFHVRPLVSALIVLAAVLIAVSFLLTPAVPTHAALADANKPRLTWTADKSLHGDTALTTIGNTIYVGGDFSDLGGTNAVALFDPNSGQPIEGLPLIDGSVARLLPDGSGGWFLVGQFTLPAYPGFAELVHIKADKTLDTSWKPPVQRVAQSSVARNSTTLFLDIYPGDPNTYPLPTVLVGFSIGNAQQTFWRPLDPDDGSITALASTDTTVYAATSRGHVIAFDIRTGARLWKWTAPDAIYTLLLRGTTLYLGGRETTGVRAINTATGQALPFHIDIGIGSHGGGDSGYYPTTVHHMALVGNTLSLLGSFTQIKINGQQATLANNRAVAIDLASGTVLPWSFPRSLIAMDAQSNLFYAYEPLAQGVPPTLFALDAATGAQIWKRELVMSSWVFTIAATPSGVLLSGQDLPRVPVSGPHLAALDKTTGISTGWKPQPNGPVTTLAASETMLYVAGSFSQIAGQPRPGLAAFEHPSGSLSAWDPQPNGPVSRMLVGGGHLYVAGSFSQIAGQPRPGLAAFDLASGALSDWNPSGLPPGTLAAFTFGRGALYVAVEPAHEPDTVYTATLVALDPASGAASWNATLPVRELRDLAVYDNRLYVLGTINMAVPSSNATSASLVMFDPSSSAPPTALLSVGSIRGLVIHDQTMYLTGGLMVKALDLSSHTELDWLPRSLCVFKMADAGSDLLMVGCDGRLRAMPYRSMPLIAGFIGSASATSATWKGKLNPNGLPTSAWLQLTSQRGACDALQIIPVSGVLTGTKDIELSIPISNLAPRTTYYYRLVASNAAGATVSELDLFSTGNLSIASEAGPAALPSGFSPAPAEATATPGWQVFLPALRRCPTDGF